MLVSFPLQNRSSPIHGLASFAWAASASPAALLGETGSCQASTVMVYWSNMWVFVLEVLENSKLKLQVQIYEYDITHRIHACYIWWHLQYTPNVSIYTIHGSYGLYDILTYLWCDLGKWKTTLADVLWAIFCNQIINSTDICGCKFSIVSWHVGTDILSLKQAWKRKMTLCFIKFHYHGCFI